MLEGILGLVIFFLITIGLFNILNINFLSITNQGLNYLMQDKKINIKKRVNILKGKNKENYVISQIKRVNYILEITNKKRQLPFIFAIACLSGLVGISICVAINNVYLMPVLSTGLFLVPFFIMETQMNLYKEELTSELETVMSIITTSYLRTENIILSVKENLDFINPPLQQYFKEFLINTQVNPNTEYALKILQNSIENKIFKEWCEALISCQSNHTLKTVLNPIVAKLSDLQVVNTELDMLFAKPKNDFLTMVGIIGIGLPMLLVMNKSWIAGLLTTQIGKIALAIGVGLIFYAILSVMKLIKPLED
ncbi:type II secretion system F family protein [[Clostridium] colinum]|uniref:type II secretion system F family protein n=1 Tax=[Clostridium] colinum TaxID=36835 RepID=UPI00202573B5|nr:hypothetical protein [[Clostridium] colinum]